MTRKRASCWGWFPANSCLQLLEGDWLEESKLDASAGLTNRLLDVSPAEMGLFRLSRQPSVQGLQPWKAMCRPLYSQGRRSLLERQKRALVNLGLVHGFSLASHCQERVFLLPAGLWDGHRAETAPFCSPSSICLLRFQLTNFLQIHDKAILKSKWELVVGNRAFPAISINKESQPSVIPAHQMWISEPRKDSAAIQQPSSCHHKLPPLPTVSK